MVHPLIEQLRFTRSEFLRGLAGVTESDACRHAGPMNSISWIVGHLAWHEHRYWLKDAQNRSIYPALDDIYAQGAPMSTPDFAEMLALWQNVTRKADPFLDKLTTESLQSELLRNGLSIGRSVGSGLRRITYHYWYHIGEIQAILQLLGNSDLPEFVGDIEIEAPYRPEASKVSQDNPGLPDLPQDVENYNP